jgi:hypothetical protein
MVCRAAILPATTTLTLDRMNSPGAPPEGTTKKGNGMEHAAERYSVLVLFGSGAASREEYLDTFQAVARQVGEILQPYANAGGGRLHVQARNASGAKRSLRHKTLTPERLAAVTSTLAADDFYHLVLQDLAFADRSNAPAVYADLISFAGDLEICVTMAVRNDLLPARARALEPPARTLTGLVNAYYGCIEQEAGWLFTSVPPPTIYDPIVRRPLTRHPGRPAARPMFYWGNLVPRAWLAQPAADDPLPAGIVAVLEDWSPDLVYVRFSQAAQTSRQRRSALARSFFRFPSPASVSGTGEPMQPPTPGPDHDGARSV